MNSWDENSGEVRQPSPSLLGKNLSIWMRGTRCSFLHRAMSHADMTPWVARSDISTAYIFIPDYPMMFSSSRSLAHRTAEMWPCPKHPTNPHITGTHGHRCLVTLAKDMGKSLCPFDQEELHPVLL